MLDLFNIAKPQGCDIQTFVGSGTSTNSRNQKSWNKPRGVSHVYMLLIGRGGDGDGLTGGGSGAVTVWYGAAQNVPDQLNIGVYSSSTVDTTVRYKNGSDAILLSAGSAGGTSADVPGAAMTANQFTASGFFQSVAGQTGLAGSVSASTTTFLSAGGAVTSGTQASNYGYSLGGTSTADRSGFLLFQPIIVGAGGMKASNGGIGCGGGGSGLGGPGMVLIASW